MRKMSSFWYGAIKEKDLEQEREEDCVSDLLSSSFNAAVAKAQKKNVALHEKDKVGVLFTSNPISDPNSFSRKMGESAKALYTGNEDTVLAVFLEETVKKRKNRAKKKRRK